MVRTQQWRGAWLAPVLTTLARWKIRPDVVTLTSTIVGLAFCPLLFYWPPGALLALAMHVALDGLDGPLARHLGTASRRGSFTDTMSDQLVVVASTVALMADHHLAVLPGGLYIFLYTVVVLFALARNALAIPYSWLVRPRFVVFAWIAVELYLVPGSLDYVIWIFNVLLAAKMLTGFARIRDRL